jgi:thymidylate kinase
MTIPRTRPKSKAIIFFGPDGSGKTTQAELLLQRLRNDGIKTRKLWLRSLHTLAFIISRVAMSVFNYHSVYDFRKKYSPKKSFQPFWYAIEFVSILPLVLFRFDVPMLRGNTIIAERYVIDWIISLSYVSRNDALLYSTLAKIVLRFVPRDAILLYIDADYETICSRGRTEDSYEFIQFQRMSYMKVARLLGALVIDTSNKNVNEVHELICNYVLEVEAKNA